LEREVGEELRVEEIDKERPVLEAKDGDGAARCVSDGEVVDGKS
jgi:hypothetical protein